MLQYPAGKATEAYTIPSTVEKIEIGAFSGSKINGITFSSALKTIDIRAFYGCNELTTVTIPTTVTKVGESAFGACTKLTEIKVADGHAQYESIDGILFNKESEKALIQYPAGKTTTEYTVPEGIIRIGISAFEGTTKLTKITIPSSVTEVAFRAFYGCSSLNEVYYKGETEPVTCRGSAFDNTPIKSIKVVVNYKENSFCDLDVVGNEPADKAPEEKPATPNKSSSILLTLFTVLIIFLI